MAYRLHPDEPLQAGLVRVAQEQLRTAESELRDGVADDPVQAIHSARKAVKKERALLRLARSATPGSVRRGENGALRDAARRLSEARDAEVMVQALDDLHERYARQVPKAAFAALRADLEQERILARAQLANPDLAPSVADELAAIRERIAQWPLEAGGWKAIGPGLRRSYEQGREAFQRAREQRDDDSLHDWRKRAKDLWYHLRLLAPIGGPAVGGQAKEAHVLADLLGDDHDLAVLRGALTARGSHVADLEALLGLIDHRREQLQAEAMFVGEQAYAETPKAFSRRLRRRWRAGRALAQREQAKKHEELAQATGTAATP